MFYNVGIYPKEDAPINTHYLSKISKLLVLVFIVFVVSILLCSCRAVQEYGILQDIKERDENIPRLCLEISSFSAVCRETGGSEYRIFAYVSAKNDKYLYLASYSITYEKRGGDIADFKILSSSIAPCAAQSGALNDHTPLLTYISEVFRDFLNNLKALQ